MAASSPFSSRAATMEATTCGAWETSATARSWALASRTKGSAPHRWATSVTAAIAPGSALPVGHSAQARPRNRSARAAPGPCFSLPPMGCPGMNVARSQPNSSAPSTTRTLTLETSVYTWATPRSCSSCSTWGTTSGGAATTATSAGGSSAASSRGLPAPRSRAIRIDALSGSDSRTSTPRLRSASATDVPTSPVPTTATRSTRGRCSPAPPGFSVLTAALPTSTCLVPSAYGYARNAYWAMSRRSAWAPRRYTCWICVRGRSVSTCAINRTTLGRAWGTEISVEHINGTSAKPSSRAANAGNSLVRSGVAVNSTLITSSVVNSLRRITSATSSAVASSTCSRSSASTCTAPRMARTATFAPALSLIVLAVSEKEGDGGHGLRGRGRRRPRLQAHGLVELAHLLGGECPHRARLEGLEIDRTDLGACQVRDRVSHRFHEAPHDVFAALVQTDLDQRLGFDVVHHTEGVDLHRSVVQFHPCAQAFHHAVGYRTGHLGDVCLGDPVSRVGEPVGDLTVVGQQNEPLGLGVQSSHVEDTFRGLAGEVGQGGAALGVPHGADDTARRVEREVERGGRLEGGRGGREGGVR